jgi:TP901 family phage tail tape measure protein
LADVNSNININFNTAAALAQLRSLQAGLSKFHQTLAEGNLAAANAQKGLNAQLLQSIGATGKFSASQVKVAGSTLAFTSALEKNKLSLREYYRYTMAAATANTRVMGKAFAQEREIINRARRDRVKSLQSQYIQMNKANSGFMDAIRVMPKSLQMAGGKFTELGTRIQYAAQRQQFLNQLLKQGSTQLLNFGKNTQWAGRQLMVGLTMPLALFGSAAAKAFKELDAEIVKFRRVYGDAFTNDAEVEAAVQNIRKLGTEYTKYGVAVKDTMNMAATAAAAGFTGSDLTAQVETATKLAVLGQVEQQQALETTISLQSAFGLSSEELAKKIDFLNAVENQTLLSIEDLTIAIPKAAPVVKQLGGSVEDLAFFLTAMKEGGINASEGANALKSGLASLINPSDKAAKFMGNLGINIKGLVEANKGDIKGTVVGFARALDELDPLNRARAIEQMFGKFQFARLSTLFQNVTKDGSQASRAFELAGASIEELAILSEREMKKIEDSTGVKFQAAIEQFKQEIMPLGKAFLEALTPVVKFFGNLFEKFNGLGDQTKKVVATIVAVVAGLGPVLLMTFGLLANGVANVIKFFAMLRGGIAKLNGQTNVMGAGFNYMTQEQIENAASSQQLHQTHTRLIEVFNVEKASVSALAASYNSLSTQMRSMASQNPALFAGGMGGAKRAVSKLPPVKKYQEGILSVPGPKGAGDVVPAMLSPGEAVIPTKTTDKYRGLITAMFQDKVPGFMAGRIPGGPGKGLPLSAGPAAVRAAQQAKYRKRDDARQGYDEPHPEKKSGPTFVGMPKSAAETSQSRQILDKIAGSVQAGRFGSVAPTNFGTLLQPFSGRSFPVRGVGGVYRKPNGQIVVVKPTIDDKTALAEVRATQIAREVHGLVAPKQTIKTMIDPTDPTGQRKFIVIESPYDPRIAKMDGKFSKSDMVKQLVASTLRGDKDLQQPNLSGNVLADVGTAGVFDRASGFRDFSKAMPSMEQQAVINLLGVKGGAKKFFAQATSGIAGKMTPAQYDAAIKEEIKKSIPRLQRVIKSFDLTPDEQVVYGDMLKRLEAGAKTDWSKLHPMHTRAGDGVVKAITGVDPDASNSIVEKQLAKYNVPEGEQVSRLVNDLKASAQSEFTSKLGTLDPQRRAIVEAAWSGGKAVVPPSGKEQSFNTPRQTAFLDEISKMVPVKVGDEIKYVHKDDYDKFKSDPDGRARYARSSQQIIDNMLYRMGVTKRGDSFVAGGGFTGRFAGVDHFRTDLKSTGKTAGGGSATLSPIVRSIADAQKAEFNARVGDPLKTKTGKAMLAAGFPPDKVRYFLRPELSHIVPTESLGIGGREGALKMKTGTAQYDSRLLNTFMLAKKRSSNILDWNGPKNPLRLTDAQTQEYKKAADFMARGLHPSTKEERALVAKAAELDQRVFKFKKDGGVVSAKLLPKDIRLSQALSTVLGDKAFVPSKIMNLAATDPSQVLVKPGEYKLDKNTGTLTKLTTANTGPKPPGTVPSTNKQSDRRLSSEGPGQTTLTKTQAARIATARGLRVIPGRDKGDPGLKNPTVKQGQLATELRAKGFSQSEIDRTLRRFAERELKAKQATAIAAEKAARVEAARQKEQASIQKRQTEDARKRYVEGQRRAELNRQQALNYDAAVKEDQQRTIKAQKQTQKEQSKQNRVARAEKVGRMSGGASMALGTAGMGLMMAGQQTAGMAAMGASAVAGMAPMLAGMSKFGLAATAVAVVGGGLYLLNEAAKKAAAGQSKYVDQITATTEKMKGIGALTGKVGASELYARKRKEGSDNRFTEGFDRGKEQFGETFLSNEVGKTVFEGFKKSLTEGGIDSAKQIAIQLAAYVSDGVMTAEQANSVASQIGIELGNSTLSTKISGTLLELIGPEGQDLVKDPLNVRLKIVKEQSKLNADVEENLMQNIKDEYLTFNPLKFFSPTFGESEGEKASAQYAALNVQNLEAIKAQEDSLSKLYDTQVASLLKQKEATSDKEKQKKIDQDILALETKKKDGLAELRKETKGILDKQVKTYSKLKNAPDDYYSKAFMGSLDTQVKTKYEGNPYAETFLDTAKDKLKSEELEVKIKTFVAYEGASPEAGTTLIKLFGEGEKNEAELDATLDLLTTQDSGETISLLNSLSVLNSKKNAKKIFVDIVNMDPKTRADTIDAIGLVEKMAGKEINIQTFFSSKDENGKEIDPKAKLVALTKSLQAIDKVKGPITKSLLIETEEIGGVSLEGLIPLWDQWQNEPESTKRTIIAEYITIEKTITQGDIDAQRNKNLAASGGSETMRNYYDSPAGQDALKAQVARERLMQSVNADIAAKNALGLGDGDSSGKKVDPYEALLQRLKNVRNAAINAAGGIKELNKALTAGNSKSVENRFRGVEQQMNKKKLNAQFIDFAMSQDPVEQKKYFTTAGPKIKKGKNKGRIVNPYNPKKFLKEGAKEGDVVLSELGKTYNKYFDAAVVGEFNVGAQKSLDLLNKQDLVRRKLVAAQYDSATIENILQDEYTTSAIAAGTITQIELETNALLTKQLSNREKINNMISKGTAAIQEQKNRQKIPDVANFLKGQGVSNDSLRSIIGDPDQLSEAIAAMDEYAKGGEAAATALEEIVAGLKAIQANSDIKVAIQFATSNVASQIQQGYESAQKIMDSKRTIYNNLSLEKLGSATSEYVGTGKAAQQVGAIAKATVDKRYADTQTKIPTLGANQTIKSIQADRATKAKSISLSSANLQSAQAERDAKYSQISDAENSLQDAEARANEGVDKAIKAVQNVIKGYQNQIKGIEKTIKGKEDEIKKQYTDKIEVLNKENQVFSNDLAIMDKAAEDINEKYDKQVEALQKVNELNQQIVESQGQQLDLADALTSGDIAAAAKAAQAMRATSAASYGDSMMKGLENARTNELDSQVGAESGKTRKQISERQFAISQEIYALETDPKRLEIEKEILALRESIIPIQEDIILKEEEINGLEEGRAAVVAKAVESQKATLQALKDSLVPLDAAVASHQGILEKLEKDDALLAAQEGYLTAIAEEAVAIDDTTGMTLEKWAETVDKVMSIEEMAIEYAKATEAAAKAVDAANTSWGNILDKINAIPKSVETKYIVNEIRNVTTVFDSTASDAAAADAKAKADAAAADAKARAEKIATALRKLSSGQKLTPEERALLAMSPDEKSDDAAAQAKAIADKKAADEKAAADAKAAKEAAARAGMYDPNDPSHKGSKEQGLALYPWIRTLGAAADATLKGYGYWAKGGIVAPGKTARGVGALKFAAGNLAKGTDTVPAMLTPGEFIMSKYAVDSYGVDTMRKINNGDSVGGTVYNNTYTLTVNAKTDANPNDIAQAVMSTIKRVDDRRIRGVSLNGR